MKIRPRMPLTVAMFAILLAAIVFAVLRPGRDARVAARAERYLASVRPDLNLAGYDHHVTWVDREEAQIRFSRRTGNVAHTIRVRSGRDGSCAFRNEMRSMDNGLSSIILRPSPNAPAPGPPSPPNDAEIP